MAILRKYQNGAKVEKPLLANYTPKPVKHGSYAITPKDNKLGWVQRNNPNILIPGEVTEPAYVGLNKWTPAYNPKDPTRLDDTAESNAAIIAERNRRNAEIMEFRQGVQKNYGIDKNTMGVDDVIDPNAVYPKGHQKAGQRKITESDLDRYYKNLEWKQNYRKRAGFNLKQYYGAKEGQQKGYDDKTNIRDLNFGYRLVTGSQAAPKLKKGGVLQAPKGGLMKYQKGKKLNSKVLKSIGKAAGKAAKKVIKASK